MDPLGPRSLSRSVLRSLVDELRETGLFEAVRAGVSDELGALLDRPRDAPAWLPAAPFDELDAAVYRLRGRDGLREFLHHSVRTGIAHVLEPVIQFSLGFLGGTPASLFSRSSSLLAVNSRGVEMTWVPSSPTSGTMRIRCGEPVPPITWIAWEGIFEYVIEIAGHTGTVGEARPSADGCGCEIDVKWNAK
jgi:hypothetical protein